MKKRFLTELTENTEVARCHAHLSLTGLTRSTRLKNKICENLRNLWLKKQKWHRPPSSLPLRVCMLLLGSVILTPATFAANVYNIDRTFTPVEKSGSTLYEILHMAAQLTNIVGPTNIVIVTNQCKAIEYETVAWGYNSPQTAWNAVVSNFPSGSNVHSNEFFDNPGWVRGAHDAYEDSGAYLWKLENHLAFTTSVTDVWISPHGVTNEIEQVLVGTIGDYDPQTFTINIGPTNKTANIDYGTFLGAEASTQTTFAMDLTTYYQIKSPLQPRLVVDYNHDRTIDAQDRSRAATGEVFRFWINDDDDKSADAKTGGDDDRPGAGTKDTHDDSVDGMRDFIDFFPLYVDLKSTLDLLGTDDYSYILDYDGNGSVGLIYTELTPITAGNYLTNVNTAEVLLDSTVYRISGLPGGHTLHQPFLNNIQHNNGGILLVEFSDEGTDPLRLEIRNTSDDLILSTNLNVSMSGVEDMFRLVTLVDDLDTAETQTVTVVERKGAPANFPDHLCNSNNFVFIHGFNVDQQDARVWLCEAFKRMYWSGSLAKFTGVTWHGGKENYHKGVINALVTSKSLATELSFLTGEVTIAAHSLGNMVVSSAIQDYGFTPDRYFLLNAAVPISAYDASQTNGQNNVNMLNYMTHPNWAPYEQRLWASYWYELFSPTDRRSELTWENRFSDVAQYAYNFYSEGEDVVRNADTTTWGMIGAQFDNKGEYAWPMQELIKGIDGPLGAFAYNWLVPDQHAGWAFNPTHDTSAITPGTQPPDPATTVLWTPEQLRTNQLFEPFIAAGQGEAARFTNYNGHALFKPDNDPAASAQAGLEETQFKLLAEAIPALTFAAAANEIPKFDPPVGDGRNFHMQDLRSVHWPVVRLNDQYLGSRWLHSDIKDIAYVYISKIYDEIVRVGALK